MLNLMPQNKWTESAVKALIGTFEKMADGHPQHLVVMRFLDSPAPYLKGQLAGLPPDSAARHYRFKMAVPVTPEGEEIPLPGVRVEAPAHPAASNTVEIPDDWYGLHHLQRLKLAKAISGSDNPMNVTEADDVIAREVQRRKEGSDNGDISNEK